MCKYTILPLSLSASKIYSVKPEPVTTLWSYLHQVPDPRRPQGTRHPLPIILLLAILAHCCGYSSYASMAEWSENYQHILKKKLPFLAGHTPDASTFYRVFSRLDVNAFENVIKEWVQTLVVVQPGEAISLDGKTVGKDKLHLVSAFTHFMCGVLFQHGSETKGKELVTGRFVLSHLPLASHIFTGDALYAQRDICQTITEGAGGYVFTVKDNQKKLAEDIRLFFSHPPHGDDIVSKTKLEKNKGRIEKRTIEVSSDLVSYLNWPGLTHVWRLIRTVTRNGNKTTEIVVGIARLLDKDSPEQQLPQLIRGHWMIENRLHRPRNTLFDEDKSTIENAKAQQVMAALRNMVLTIFTSATVRSLTAACRRFAARPEELFWLLGLDKVQQPCLV